MELVSPMSSDKPIVGKTAQATVSSSALAVTLIGCGGAGLNVVRIFKEASDSPFKNVLFFDTSSANLKPGESVNVIGSSGGGSGSNRKENARRLEAVVPQIPDEELGLADVVIIVTSLGGGSGSVIAPLLAREYTRRAIRVIVLGISDTSSGVCATNNLNTLRTFAAIAKKNEIYLPMVLVTNDNVSDPRKDVNDAVTQILAHLGGLLTTPVYEVDKSDRLNWVNPTKVVPSEPGIKLLRVQSPKHPLDPKVVVGLGSTEMVDSMLILQPANVVTLPTQPPARLKKDGIYVTDHSPLVGTVSSDISSIDEIISRVERMQTIDKAQKHESVSKLQVSGDDELIL